MMRIVALVGDGHTRIDPRKDENFQFESLPLKLYDFDDGIFVRAADPRFARLVGWRVEAVGGVPIAEAQRRVGELISADTEMGKRQLAPLYLEMPEILQALGLSDSQESARLTLTRGKERQTVTIAATQVNPEWPSDTDIALTTPKGWVDACAGPPPLYLQNPLDYHRLIELPAAKALYAQLNWVADIEGDTLSAYSKRILERGTATNPRAVILDLRLDQGGNGNLSTSLVDTLIKLEDDDTRLFVLTGRGTFSASQFILNDLDRLTGAVFIGEHASSKPSSYGDAFKTQLPNSKIDMRTSIYWWQEGQNFDPYTWIDIAAPLRFADYAACRDPALERALAYSPPNPLEDTFLEAAQAGGLEGARKAVKAYLAAAENRYANVQLVLPRAAEKVFIKGHTPEAVVVAQAVSEVLPKTIDAWVVLAYVAIKNGDKPLAARAAQQALVLDPNNRTARDLLEEATGKAA
jgi:tetratricopeptide (TPR) repeat protein